MKPGSCFQKRRGGYAADADLWLPHELVMKKASIRRDSPKSQHPAKKGGQRNTAREGRTGPQKMNAPKKVSKENKGYRHMSRV